MIMGDQYFVDDFEIRVRNIDKTTKEFIIKKDPTVMDSRKYVMMVYSYPELVHLRDLLDTVIEEEKPHIEPEFNRFAELDYSEV